MPSLSARAFGEVDDFGSRTSLMCELTWNVVRGVQCVESQILVSRPLRTTGLDNIRRHFLHVKGLEFGEGARHVEERQRRLAVDDDFEAALARLLLVDDNLCSWEACLHERLQLGGPRLKRTSGFARLNLNRGATGGGALRSRLRCSCLRLLLNGLLGCHGALPSVRQGRRSRTESDLPSGSGPVPADFPVPTSAVLQRTISCVHACVCVTHSDVSCPALPLNRTAQPVQTSL